MRNKLPVLLLLFALGSPILCAFIPVSRHRSSRFRFHRFRKRTTTTSPHSATLAECAHCTSSSQCTTGLCSGSRCIFNSLSSVEKCFPSILGSSISNSPSPSIHLPRIPPGANVSPPRPDECSACSADSNCRSGLCFNGKCIDLSSESLGRCFSAECASCSSSSDCETELCESGVCVFDSKASRERCAVSPHRTNSSEVGNNGSHGTSSHGNANRNDSTFDAVSGATSTNPTSTATHCVGCTNDQDCTGIVSGFCYNSKCTDGSDSSLDLCFKPECGPCTVPSDCITQLCDTAIGLCVFDTSDSKDGCLRKQAEQTPSPSAIPTPSIPSRSLPSFSNAPIPSTTSTTMVASSVPATSLIPRPIVLASPTSSQSATTNVRAECATCAKNGECGKERLCYNGKCVDGSNDSLNKCFQGECAFCLSSTDCVTESCENNTCVFDSNDSRDKCATSSTTSSSPSPTSQSSLLSTGTPSPTTSSSIITTSTSPLTSPTVTTTTIIVDECASCTDDSECSGGGTGVCFNGRCTDGGDAAKLRCFEDECGPCESSADCASEICTDDGQCVFDTTESRDKCAAQREEDDDEGNGNTSASIDDTTDKKQECELCLNADECAGGSCLNRRCSDGSEASLQKCFLPECAFCNSSRQCATGYCDTDVVKSNDGTQSSAGIGKCTLGTTTSQDLCRAKLSECARCRFNSQCAVGKCWGARCTDASEESLKRCFKKECTRCTSHFQCSTMYCGGGRCIFKDNRQSSVKCFGSEGTKKQCEACESGSECMQGVCWRKKCTNGTFRSRWKCFVRDCEACTSNRECYSRACVDGRCGDRRTKTTEMCNT